MYGVIHTGFSSLLDETIETGIQPPVSAILLFLFIVLIGSAHWFNSSSEANFKSLYYSISLARAIRRTPS